MNCRDCGCRLEVLKTMVMEDVTQRLRECACGSRFLTTEVITRKLPVTAGQPPGNAPPTPRQPPGNSSPQSSSSGSSLTLPVSKSPDQTHARVELVDPVVRSFAVVGRGGPTWNLLESAHKKFVAAFPGVDVTAEYAKIDVWLEAHPTRRKTAGGMKGFLFRWLDKEQNDAARKAPLAAVPRTTDQRCAFHRSPGTNNKPARGGPYRDCPECKHVAARNGTRASEPLRFDPSKIATAEELASLRKVGGNG